MKNIALWLFLASTIPFGAGEEKANKPILVNSTGCACDVEGPDEVCTLDSTIDLVIRLKGGKPKEVECKIEIKGTSDAKWENKDGKKSFTAKLNCDATKEAKPSLWTGTKPGTTIEIWVKGTKCKTISVLKCPSEIIKPKEGRCSGPPRPRAS